MIVETYPSTRKKTHTDVVIKKETRHPNATDRSRATAFKISPEEFIRRDDIVRQMYLDCTLKVGDVCEPVGAIALEMYGQCTIKDIYRTYHDFPILQGTDWPSDDRPLIVTAEPQKKPEGSNMILCTPKFLQKHYGGSCS